MANYKKVKFHNLSEDIRIPTLSKKYSYTYDFIASDSLLVEADNSLVFKTGLKIDVPEGKSLVLLSNSEFANEGIMVLSEELTSNNKEEVVCEFKNKSNEKVFIEEGKCYMHGILVNHK